MTTITNFLESNFIDSTEIKDAEINQNPIWILNVQNQSSLNQSALKQYIINHSVQAVKPLIHIDLGISLIKKYPSVQFKNIDLENGLKICQPIEGKPYFIVRTPISLRNQPNFLSKLTTQINSLHESQILKKLINETGLAKKYQGKYCLLVEGIQAMLLLNKGKEVESFISQLSNLHQCVKQISIFAHEKLITKELMFSLQRISTCLTTLTAYNQIEGVWDCTSTVRRYTGYSNQEPYTLTFQKASQKIKVAKKLNIIDLNKQTKQQKEMVKNLGFVVKKQQKDKQQSEQLKRMIYPHLKIQQQQNNANFETQNPDEGLIILDDQQEDEDDIDV